MIAADALEYDEDQTGVQEHEQGEEEKMIQNLRSKATELLLREEYEECIEAYSQIIPLCQQHISNKKTDAFHVTKLQKALCLAYSNRAEARARLSMFHAALDDCDEALRIEESHFKTLLRKGKILLSLNRYSMALGCLRSASLDPQASENLEMVNGLLEECKMLDYMSRTGAFDVSDWVSNGFRGKVPDLAEHIGAVEIKKSRISGRGLFVTKNVECGMVLLVTKAVAIDRAIMPQNSGENAQLVLWKDFVDRVEEAAAKCSRLRTLISKLSTGEDEEKMDVPHIETFSPEAEVFIPAENLTKMRMWNILDVNSILEDAISAKVLGKNADYQGIGLWILPSFINHSCEPNARRLHIGDHVIVHASRDVKAGEELTCAYIDVLQPLAQRRQMAMNCWGFTCRCARCEFEESVCCKQEMREMESMVGKQGVDMGNVVYRLEESIRRLIVRGKGKGYLRASFWEAYAEVLSSEKMIRKWGRKIPAAEMVVDSVIDAAGSDERILKVFMAGGRRGMNGEVEMEKAMKVGRGIYGRVMKKSAVRTLIQLALRD